MSDKVELIEFWISGPIANVPALLQPVAHTLLQARREVENIMIDFPDKLLWIDFAAKASPGFHLQHMAGVIGRLFTYADNKTLTEQQLAYLASEGKADNEINAGFLVNEFKIAIDKAIEQLKIIDEKTLTDFRGVGRKQLPSTVIGLLFHTAEHVMRHTGQLLVSVAVLKAQL